MEEKKGLSNGAKVAITALVVALIIIGVMLVVGPLMNGSHPFKALHG